MCNWQQTCELNSNTSDGYSQQANEQNQGEHRRYRKRHTSSHQFTCLKRK
ncbi:hypothetical protein Mal15_48060 [Stieleria maiorica]|uniref:Uncharacterized protein n=1 Tax=Stieleria maiorica TaxID=2795974 RepID=A0A5B9MII9_9BACT|nr:hypothetical protein Mal15_48060 [Stieleria maiorica]